MPRSSVTIATAHSDKRLPHVATPWKLSPSECEVLRLLCDGKDLSLVAFCMGVCRQTVSTLVLRAKLKMDAETTLHAAVMYDRHLRPTM